MIFCVNIHTYFDGKKKKKIRRKKGNIEGKKRSEDGERDKGTNKKANKKLQRL